MSLASGHSINHCGQVGDDDDAGDDNGHDYGDDYDGDFCYDYFGDVDRLDDQENKFEKETSAA